jgi:iron complex outermembrane recepter protein
MHHAKPLAIAVAMALACQIAAAQDAAETAEDEARRLEQITVTGTNLKGIDLEEAQPVVSFSAEDIRQLGVQTVSELLRQLSQLGGGTGNFTEASSGSKQGDTPAGFAGVSLRGLGTASTLTLVNGRRIAVASFASGSENFVDINAIPLAAVDRVEVLTTGASAIYGADAVAGVVNFILRRDFEGLRLSASAADSTRSTDESRYNANLVWGGTRGNARGMLIVDAFDRNAMYDRDRRISAVEPRPSQQGIYPSFNDLFDMDLDLVERSCPDDQRYDGRPGFPNSRFGAYCELNRNAYTVTLPETRRLGVYATGGYEFSGGLEYFTELALQRNTSRANSEPAPWSQEGIDFNHPDMPAELRARLIAAGADPGFPVFGWGRFPDPREIEVDTQSWRWVNGLSGFVGGWSWDSALTLSRSDSEQEAVAGIYNVARFRAALRGRLCPDGSTSCTPSSGGLYYNPFDGQASNSQQVLDLLRERVPRDGISKLAAWDLKFTGNAGTLAGGDIGWAFGFEARREDIRDDPSPLATGDPITGEVPVYGFGSTAVRAKRSQWALFGETFLPFAENFDVRLAGRYDHYDDFGGDFNPSIGLRWRANDAVLLRGGWNTSFRAPSLAQVGAGTTLGSGALPCSPGSEFFETFCDGFAGDDGYLSEIYGNPDLKAETSTAWYLGSVFSLGESTTLNIDYWNFRHRNLVGIDAFELFRLALADPSLVFDSRGTRPPVGQVAIGTRGGQIGDPIDDVYLTLINIGRQQTDGVDLSLVHELRTQNAGEFKFYVDTTWTRSFKRSETCGDDVDDDRRGVGSCRNGVRLVERVGEFRYPEWLTNVGVNWSRGSFSARAWANHTDGYYDDDQRDGVPAGRKVSSWTIFNLNLGWDIDERQYVSLGVRNLFDREPPLALGSAANVDLFNHDTLGRFLTLSYVLRY